MENSIKNIAIILGARPNFIKAAPFLRQAKSHSEFNLTIIHTGQHFDKEMSEVFFEQMQIPKPDIALSAKTGFHTEKIGKMFHELKEVFAKKSFDAIIVFGDVNSTLAGAIAAAKNGAKLIHIEAGLRSHDRRMPEEINRVIVDHLSDMLFTTEPSAKENLLKEGVSEDKIHYVGNLMIESIEVFWDKIQVCDILQKLQLEPRNYVLATFHRQENTDSRDSIVKILELLRKVGETLKVVLPLHPGTRKQITEYGMGEDLNGMVVINPLGYFEFLKLMADSKGVITDSGGIQEETSHLGVPCCTLRDNTERPITIEKGSNKLFDLRTASAQEIKEHINRSDFKSKSIEFWDDKVSKRIFDYLKKEFFHG
jgi:UDP-N-acetylglucosamine 2-epimerase (non-hydrolysing)